MSFSKRDRHQVHSLPYKGSGPGLIDLMGGQIDILFDQLSASIGYIQAGRLRALAVTTFKRAGTRPAVPTLDESGLRGFDASTRTGIMLPAATPPDIVAKVHASSDQDTAPALDPR